MDIGLNRRQRERIFTSWQNIQGNAQVFGELFYERLFMRSPHMKVYFKTSMDEQIPKFIATLSSLVSKVHSHNVFPNDFKYLASRHVNYGARPEHYVLVGEALIDALREGMKDKWDEELESCWITLYNRLSELMINSSPYSTENVA